MRKFTAMLIIVCMLLATLPAMASMDYLGDMEVVNCNEWVSLRELPSTSSKRLMKVYLGAVVNNCQQFGDDWIYAEYDGKGGYILAKYLQPFAEEILPLTMMVTIVPDDAPFYAAIDSTEPIDYIPANTIVRNCMIVDNNRVYVEWGSRCGYISLLHAEVYNEMLHFPRTITLHEALSVGEIEGATPALKVVDLKDFPIKEYDYNVYEYDDYMEADDPELPKVKFVLYSDTTVCHVHLFSVSMISWDEETGDVVYEAILEDIQYQLDPEHPLCVGAVIWGDMPNLAVGYADAEGIYHFAFIEISGEDGSLILREF